MRNNLREAIKESGLTRREIAQRCGCHFSTLSHLINEYYAPKHELRASLANVLEKKEEYLFPEEEKVLSK